MAFSLFQSKVTAIESGPLDGESVSGGPAVCTV